MTAIAATCPEPFGFIFADPGTAVGEESTNLMERSHACLKHLIFPCTTANAVPEVKFFNLKTEWEESTAALSSINAIALNASYQEIIGMGEEAIPLILTEMTKKTGHWFWALKALSGEDPIPLEARGNMKRMTELWLAWGETKGYISNG